MDCVISSSSVLCLHSVSETRVFCVRSCFSIFSVTPTVLSRSSTRIYNKRPPKKIPSPRRTQLPPPDIEFNAVLRKKPSLYGDIDDDEEDMEEGEKEDIVWGRDEVEAISSLFKGRVPQKPGKLDRQRSLPLPAPYKSRPIGLPSPKKRVKIASSSANSTGQAFYKQVYKNPRFLIGLAREIKTLPPEKDVSTVLDNWAQFLRKGSLTLTIKELGHMDLPDKALKVHLWAQKQPHLFPDDALHASTIEVLAAKEELKIRNFYNIVNCSSQHVYESLIKGFIKSGNLRKAYNLFRAARKSVRILDVGVYAKLILELANNPDNRELILYLLEELEERNYLTLTEKDCNSVMKVCVRLGRYEYVESLYEWFKKSEREPTVVMYTTVIHSRYSNKCYREALAAVWEMEGSNCLFDLPAYRVVIKVCVVLNDVPRAVRYYSKLKEAGFSPPFDIYREMIKLYRFNGRMSKCKEVCREAEMAGFKLDQRTKS